MSTESSQERQYEVVVKVTIYDKLLIEARNATEARELYWQLDSDERRERSLGSQIEDERVVEARWSR